MRRLLLRRSITAVGIYSSVVLGFLGTVAATRELHSARLFGDFATVIFATGFFQSLFDLTVEEVVVKYGFRFSTREDWGRLRRLFESALAFKLVGAALGAIALVVYALLAAPGLRVALLLAAGIPLCQSLEGLAGSALFLRSRYDIRSGFLAWSMALRFTGIAVGARYGVAQAIAGVLAAQVVATASVGVAGWLAFRRFPSAPSRPLAEERREILSFIWQSSAATGVLSLRGGLAPLLLRAVTSSVQVGFFKVAQAPQSGFQALSAPARMVLLTEQTREWEHGRQAAVLRQVRRYSAVAAALCVVIVPPALWLIPTFIRHVNGPEYLGAVGAARLFILAAAVQLVVGWTKSFPVTIGRPNLRVWTHGIEAVLVLPLVVALGRLYGATGAAIAILVGPVAFAAAWFWIFLRVEPEDAPPPEAVVAEEIEAAVL